MEGRRRGVGDRIWSLRTYRRIVFIVFCYLFVGNRQYECSSLLRSDVRKGRQLKGGSTYPLVALRHGQGWCSLGCGGRGKRRRRSERGKESEEENEMRKEGIEVDVELVE